MWDGLIYVCCWQTSPSLREVPYISVTTDHFQRFWKEPVNDCVTNFSFRFYTRRVFRKAFERFMLEIRVDPGDEHVLTAGQTAVSFSWRTEGKERRNLCPREYNNISLCIEVALSITVSLALILHERIISHNKHRHRLLLQSRVLRRRRFYNRWHPETSPEVCFIVGRIIRAFAAGGTGLVVVTLRSSVMQSHEPCCAAPSDGALGPRNVLIPTQL